MATTDKLDLFKQHKGDYAASKKAPAIVAPATGTYLALAGRTAPERLKTILRHPVRQDN